VTANSGADDGCWAYQQFQMIVPRLNTSNQFVSTSTGCALPPQTKKHRTGMEDVLGLTADRLVGFNLNCPLRLVTLANLCTSGCEVREKLSVNREVCSSNEVRPSI